MSESKKRTTYVSKHIRSQIVSLTQELKKRRIATGISQVELAKRASISQPAVNWVETGHNTQLDILMKFADIVGLQLKPEEKN